MVSDFKEWRQYLEGSMKVILIYTNHRNWEHFTTTKILKFKQAWWAQKLAAYDFKIVYRPDTKNIKADALSRRREFWETDRNDRKSSNCKVLTLLRPDQFITGKPQRNVKVILSSVLMTRMQVVTFYENLFAQTRASTEKEVEWLEE